MCARCYNIGGLVAYPREQGGVVLDQYVFRANEANPVNAEKKKTLLAVLLRNLGADLGGERTVVPGLNLDYGPITLEHSANLYLTTAQGWSAPGGDLATFPRGANTFAGVRYLVRDFTTSPLESGVTLQHPELKSNARGEAVDGISVNTTADSLFFLHTFLQTREWKPSRQNSAPPALFEYVVNYDDGTAVPVVVTLNESVASWLQAANAAPLAQSRDRLVRPGHRGRQGADGLSIPVEQSRPGQENQERDPALCGERQRLRRARPARRHRGPSSKITPAST